MPWFMNPVTACIDCQTSEGCGKQLSRFHGRHQLISGEALIQAWFLLMNGMFIFIYQRLGLGSFTDLLEYVAAINLSATPLRFSEEECFFLREYDKRAGLEPLTAEGYMIFPPTRIIAVSNYLIMARLLPKLSETAQTMLKSGARYVTFDGSNAPCDHPFLNIGIIDSHFHMDLLPSRHLTSDLSLKRSMTSKARLLYAIANYVFPGQWSKISAQMGMDPKLKFTLGVHPHMITGKTAISLFNKLEGKLDEHPEAIGIGEVGLDLTTTCRCRQTHNKNRCFQDKIDAQRQFLRLTFQLVKRLDKVLVLHVRDKGTGEAAKEVLSLLLECDLSNTRIHRHCFVGGEEEYRQWSTSLPNCYFSISSASLKDSRTIAWLLLLEKPDRLILETDSPYLADDPMGIYDIAEVVAHYFGITTSELIRVCNKNAAKLYNLAW